MNAAQYLQSLDDAHFDRLLVLKGGLHSFIELAWPHIESVPFTNGWHLEEVCEHLEAVTYGKCRRLIINIPPGCTKSMSVSVMWNVWNWILNPALRFMYASFDLSLTQRDALRVKELISTDWFQERWGFRAPMDKLQKLGLVPVHILGEKHGKQNTSGLFWTNGGGFRFSTSVGGKSTGWHAHIQVVDDPTKPQDVDAGGAHARNALQRTKDWYKNTMASRKADPAKFARVLIMQRLHEDDLAGDLIKDGTWTHLRLPMEFEPENKCETPFGGDRRTQPCELLWPERFSRMAVDETKREMGPMVSEAQLQQNPSPPHGAIFKREWFERRWDILPAGLKGRMILSWDCTFKDTTTADYVVGQVWLLHNTDYYLCDQVRGRMDFNGTRQAILDMVAKWPKAIGVLVEDKANGTAVIQALRREIAGLIPYNPKDSKEGRAHAVTPLFLAGNVLLPRQLEWVGDYVEEFVKFPKAKNDDQVDATTQALIYLTSKSTSRLKEAMARVHL